MTIDWATSGRNGAALTLRGGINNNAKNETTPENNKVLYTNLVK
jgi:hypothetical protein